MNGSIMGHETVRVQSMVKRQDQAPSMVMTIAGSISVVTPGTVGVIALRIRVVSPDQIVSRCTCVGNSHRKSRAVPR